MSNLDQNVFSLKHTMIPVEDFTGPTISEIQKFIEITDEARKEGEVGKRESGRRKRERWGR